MKLSGKFSWSCQSLKEPSVSLILILYLTDILDCYFGLLLSEGAYLSLCGAEPLELCASFLLYNLIVINFQFLIWSCMFKFNLEPSISQSRISLYSLINSSKTLIQC